MGDVVIGTIVMGVAMATGVGEARRGVTREGVVPNTANQENLAMLWAHVWSEKLRR